MRVPQLRCRRARDARGREGVMRRDRQLARRERRTVPLGGGVSPDLLGHSRGMLIGLPIARDRLSSDRRGSSGPRLGRPVPSVRSLQQRPQNRGRCTQISEIGDSRVAGQAVYGGHRQQWHAGTTQGGAASKRGVPRGPSRRPRFPLQHRRRSPAIASSSSRTTSIVASSSSSFWSTRARWSRVPRRLPTALIPCCAFIPS
jgi:hypothetical protein